MTTRISSRDFNQDLGRAKRAADQGPVIITDRAVPTYVLLNYETFQRLTGEAGPSMVERLAHPASDAVEFEPPRLAGRIFRPNPFD